jgi:hypothetical protein
MPHNKDVCQAFLKMVMNLRVTFVHVKRLLAP